MVFKKPDPLRAAEFPRSPSKLFMAHVLPFPVRGAVKLVSRQLSSAAVDAQGCVLEVPQPQSPKVQPFLRTMTEVIHGHSHHVPEHEWDPRHRTHSVLLIPLKH